MLPVLLSVSSCYFCQQTIVILRNVPETFEGPLGDGERLCINSTFPYLAVAFQQTTFLKVRYYSLEPTSSLVKTSGHFFVPSETAAIGFGHTIGHLEVQALIPGIVSLSTFAFPTECALSRYLTTMEDDSFHLANRLGLGQFAETTPTASCIWSPHPSTSVSGFVNAESRESIQVCGHFGCRTPWVNETEGGQNSVVFEANEYLRIDGNRPDFVEDYQLDLSVKRRSNFLDAAGKFDNDAEADEVKLAARDPGDVHPDLEDVAHPQAKAEPAAPVNRAPPPLVNIIGRGGNRGPGLRTVLNVLEIVCLTVVIVGAVICIVNVVVFSRASRDDAERGLLGNPNSQGAGSRFAGILPHAVPWVGQYGVYQPQPGFAYPFQGGGTSGFPAAQFPQTADAPGQQQPGNA